MTDFPKCIDCKTPMRPYGATVAKVPGTYETGGAAGRCGGCQKRFRAAAVKAAGEPRPGRPSLARLLAEKDAFAAARRARGVPPEGVLRGGYQRVDA